MLYGCGWILVCNGAVFFGRYKKPLTAEMDNFVQNWCHLNIRMLQTQGYRWESGFDLSFVMLSVFLALYNGFLSIGDKPQKSVSQARAGSPCRFVSLFFLQGYCVFLFFSWMAFCVPLWIVFWTDTVLKVPSGQVYVSNVAQWKWL